MSKRKIILGVLVLTGLVIAAVSILVVGPALAKETEHKSTSDVMWTFESDDPAFSNPNGTSTLIRTKNGISANYKTSGLTPGSTATLWFIVFNDPLACSDECGVDDLGPGPAQGDFLLASGQVIGSDGNATFGGHLSVGDTSGSGLNELPSCPDGDCGIGLLYPETALVVLALHSHGPAMKGQELKAQISSFTGGCVVFQDVDNDGFANGPEDIPDALGECSTMQVSPHAP